MQREYARLGLKMRRKWNRNVIRGITTANVAFGVVAWFWPIGFVPARLRLQGGDHCWSEWKKGWSLIFPSLT